MLTRVNSLLAPVQVALGVAGHPDEWRRRQRVRRPRRGARVVGVVAVGDVTWCAVASRCRRGVAQPIETGATECRRLGRRAGFGRCPAATGRQAQHAPRGRTRRGVRRRHRAAAEARRRRCHDRVAAGATARLDGHGVDVVDPRPPSEGNEPRRAERRPHGRRAAGRAAARPGGVRVVVALRTPAQLGARRRHPGDRAPREGQGVAGRRRAPRRGGSVSASTCHRRRGGASRVPRCDHSRADARARRAGRAPVAVRRAMPASSRSCRAGQQRGQRLASRYDSRSPRPLRRAAT